MWVRMRSTGLACDQGGDACNLVRAVELPPVLFAEPVVALGRERSVSRRAAGDRYQD